MGLIDETPVEILQHEGEFFMLLALYRQEAPMRVLEIGTLHGGTLYWWLKEAAPGATIVTLDFHTDATTLEDGRFKHPEWLAASKAGSLEVIQGDSCAEDTVEIISRFEPFDWLFIDGDHYYESARSDWLNYSPMVRSGGVVVIHDIVARPDVPWIEVDRLWDELKDEGYSMIELIDAGSTDMGLGVIRMP